MENVTNAIEMLYHIRLAVSVFVLLFTISTLCQENLDGVRDENGMRVLRETIKHVKHVKMIEHAVNYRVSGICVTCLRFLCYGKHETHSKTTELL